MISDVLAQAISDIRGYQRDLPKVYRDLKPRIDRLVAEMDKLRDELDTAPQD